MIRQIGGCTVESDVWVNVNKSWRVEFTWFSLVKCSHNFFGSVQIRCWTSSGSPRNGEAKDSSLWNAGKRLKFDTTRHVQFDIVSLDFPFLGHKASKYQSSVCEEQLEDNSSHPDDETTDVKPIIYDLRLFQPRVALCRMSDEDILATRERFKTSEIPHHLEEIPEVSFDVKLENEESDSDQDIDGSWESDGEVRNNMVSYCTLL